MFWGLGDGCIKDASVDERDGRNRSLDVVDDDGVGWVIAFCLWSPDRFGFRSGRARCRALWIGGAPYWSSKGGLLSMVLSHVELPGVKLAVANSFGSLYSCFLSIKALLEQRCSTELIQTTSSSLNDPLLSGGHVRGFVHGGGSIVVEEVSRDGREPYGGAEPWGSLG